MMMGPAPMIMTDLMSVRLGMSLSLRVGGAAGSAALTRALEGGSAPDGGAFLFDGDSDGLAGRHHDLDNIVFDFFRETDEVHYFADFKNPNL